MKQVKLIIIEYFKISKILSFQHVINIFKLLVRLFYISFCTMSLKAGVYFFLLIDLRERERERKRQRLVAPLINAFIGLFSYVPWLGIKPTTLGYQYDTNQLSGRDRAGVYISDLQRISVWTGHIPSAQRPTLTSGYHTGRHNSTSIGEGNSIGPE